MNARLPLIVALSFSPPAQAASDEAINTGWLVRASVLVFFMQAGFALMFGSNITGWFGMSHFAPQQGEPWDFTLLLFQPMFAVTAATIAPDELSRRA